MGVHFSGSNNLNFAPRLAVPEWMFSQSQSQKIMRRALASAYHAYRLLLGGRGKDKGCVCVGVYVCVSVCV